MFASCVRCMILGVGVLFTSLLSVSAAPAPPKSVLSDKYLLNDTDLLVVVNVKEVLASPLFARFHRKQVEDFLKSEQGQLLFKDAGFDPLRDVERILVMQDRSCCPSKDSPAGAGPVLLLQGRFEADKLKTKLTTLAKDKPSGVKVEVKGETYELTLANLPPRFLAPLDGNTLILAGRREQVVEALAKASSKKKTALKYSSIRSFLREYKADSPVQMVSDGEAIWSTTYRARSTPQGGYGPVEIHQQMTLADGGIRGLMARFTVGETLKGRAVAKAQDEEKAKELAQILKKRVEEAKQQPAERTKQGLIVKTLQSVTITTREDRLVINVEMEDEFIMEFIKHFLVHTLPQPPKRR